jgi:predicted membrane channel-forming protein YqfA (hemolysin III family)
MLHVIWHLFVLAGSAAHWWAIYAHVLLPVD